MPRPQGLRYELATTSAVRAFRAPVILAGRPRWEPPASDPERTDGLLALDGLTTALGRLPEAGRLTRSAEGGYIPLEAPSGPAT